MDGSIQWRGSFSGDGDNDEELLLIDIEKKVEWYKIMELLNTKIWVNRTEESILYGTILYPS